ncbi:MerR family transcriptional regulator [Actinomycetes bacterium KLBMP 9797]
MPTRRALRPIDLARSVGVSTQQIRNYLADGILPPAPRTPTGYRVLDDRHQRALSTYRALAPGYGWAAAREIMRAVHAGDEGLALSLVDAAHAALHAERGSLRATAEALETVAAAPARAEPDGLRVGEVARLLGVRPSALRVWESAGLLVPERERGTRYRRFRATDVRDARMVDMLRRGRYPLTAIRPILDGLRRTGGSAALRAAVADRQAALTRRSAAMLAGAAALHAYLSPS